MKSIPDLRNAEEVRAHFAKLLPKVERTTGLTHRWTGHVAITDETMGGSPRYRAKFGFNGDLAVHEAYLGTDLLRESLVHEAMHAVSVGNTRTAFDTYQGFEEGVVEMCARLLAPTIVGKRRADALMTARWAFEQDIVALERLRELAGMEEVDFYVGLLRTHLAERFAQVVEWVRRADPVMPRARSLSQVASVAARLIRR